MQREKVESLKEIIRQNGKCDDIYCEQCWFDIKNNKHCHVRLYEQRLNIAKKMLREEKLNRIINEN